jgi:hypothetical protein
MVAMLSRLKAWFLGRQQPRAKLPPRHERRQAARQRHYIDDKPAWTDEDRHLERLGIREVEDIAPGTPGYPGGRRLIDE